MYIFDLDGTLALDFHRKHFLHQTPRDWNSYFEACDLDELNVPVAEIMRTLMLYDPVAIITGRTEKVKSKTLHWLNENGIQYSYLKMRKEGDFRDDCEVKSELLQELTDETGLQVKAIFDDRQRVVDMWRANGFTCLQVAPGNF